MFELDGITEAGRAFVFKLSLCNPFARSAGIFFSKSTNFTKILQNFAKISRISENFAKFCEICQKMSKFLQKFAMFLQKFAKLAREKMIFL